MKTGLPSHLPRRLLIAFLAISATATIGSVAALAAPDCQCLANGRKVALGSVVCLQISPSQSYMARCERVLNNTSWKKLEDGCPSASYLPKSKKATDT